MTSHKKIKLLADEWAVDYKPWDTTLDYREYARHGFMEGYRQALIEINQTPGENPGKGEHHE